MSRNRQQAETFAQLGLHPDLVRSLEQAGFSQPTPIQAQAIPAVLDGKDLLASAQTGSGKTAAFLLPIVNRLLEQPRGTTRALVLTPTRELAAQIVAHHAEIAGHSRVRAMAVYGGAAMRPQEQAFRRGIDIIVATPGRLLDHFQHDYAALRGLQYLVLDEADRMLDMGFMPDIRRILAHLPKKPRQTLLFSATIPGPIAALANDLLHEPVRIQTQARQTSAVGITHGIYPVPSQLKGDLLVHLLDEGVVRNAIVFCRTKHRANRLAEKLERHGVPVARIHGNRSQAQRTEALAGFKSGRYRILVATDIVARGIDVEALEHVINFDVPAAPEDYIHRVGRTARAETRGDAFTFVAPEEEKLMRAIERQLDRRIERRVLREFDYKAKAEALEIPLEERIRRARAERNARGARGPQQSRAPRQSGSTKQSSSTHQERASQRGRPPRQRRPARQRKAG